ncbi:RNA polymerase sigma-70 factor [Pedobacter sp. BS3]|uniref:RNA polymerase sigma factor n=1 Tax=Pedobacter sp. BS3 TaxID=2567937 RepID=UPI0011EBB796|nr:RNA polymerase sigma-70 factor [Pedobacter sp. BS3]TZF84874.1 RNA polymerase sigma-70 factor [Pedobacter sp. BS3]
MALYPEFDEEQLLVLLQSGDKKSFEELYHRYKVRIYGNLVKLTKSEDLAEELLQEVFIKVWCKRETIDPQRSFRSYLFKIAENLVYDLFRKAACDKKLEAHLMAVATEFYSHIDEMISNKESLALINEAVDQLPPQRKHIYTLCKLEGKSYEEVSRQLGISTSTVNDHIVKGSRSVREYLFLIQDVALVLCLFIMGL